MSLEIPSGSITVMKVNTPPTGWTKTNTFNLHALRVVSGTVSSGGTVDYTSAFTTLSTTVSSSTASSGGTSLTLDQIPIHNHVYNTASGTQVMSTVVPPNSSSLGPVAIPGTTGSPGPGSGTNAHSHPITAPVSNIDGTLDMRVKYVDTILVQRS